MNGGLVTYTPNLNYFGNDSFSYLVSDGILSSNESVVTLSVLSISNSPSITTAQSIAKLQKILNMFIKLIRIQIMMHLIMH